MLALLGLGWVRAAGAALIAIAIFFFGWYVNGCRWEAKYQKLDAQYQSFVAGVAALGEQAKAQNAIIALANLKAKEKADEENRRNTASLRADIQRLRDAAGAGSGGLSAPAPSPSSPDRICFDPTELAGALRSLDESLLGIVGEGAAAVIDLNTSKQWAQSPRSQ